MQDTPGQDTPTQTTPSKTKKSTDTARKRRTVAQVEAEAKQREAELQRQIEELQAATASQRKNETVMLSARVPRRLREQAKHLGMLTDMNMQDVVIEALEAWVEERISERVPSEFIDSLFIDED